MHTSTISPTDHNAIDPMKWLDALWRIIRPLLVFFGADPHKLDALWSYFKIRYELLFNFGPIEVNEHRSECTQTDTPDCEELSPAGTSYGPCTSERCPKLQTLKHKMCTNKDCPKMKSDEEKGPPTFYVDLDDPNVIAVRDVCRSLDG